MTCKIFELGIHSGSRPFEIDNRIRFGITDETIIEIVNKEKPKIIGLGCMFSRHYIDVLYIARLIKKTNPNIKVVIGGSHASSYVDIVLKEKAFDFIVLGEGEITFLELCKRILSNENNFSEIAGIAYRDENKYVITTKRELIKDLDFLPIVDYSLIDISKYLEDTKISPFLMRYPSLSVISSRGCPGKCIFCTVRNVWGRSWRGRSPNHFVDELETLRQQYGIREFAILDDSASVNRKRWIDICDEIIKRKLDIKWTTPSGIAHWTLNKDIIKKMKEAGCYRVTFGIESANPETRRFINKPYSLAQAKELIDFANRIGMWTISTNIIGFPYEKREAIEDTIKYAKSSGVDFATFYLLCPDITSDVYSYFRKENLLNFDSLFVSEQLDEEAYEKMEKTLSEEGTDTLCFSSSQLKAIQIQAYRRFILHRGLSFLFTKRLFYKINNIEDLKCVIRYVFVGFKIFYKSFFKKDTHALLYD